MGCYDEWHVCEFNVTEKWINFQIFEKYYAWWIIKLNYVNWNVEMMINVNGS